MATPRLTAFLGSGPPARLRLASAHCRLNEPVFVEEEGLPEPSNEAVSKSVVAPTGGPTVRISFPPAASLLRTVQSSGAADRGDRRFESISLHRRVHFPREPSGRTEWSGRSPPRRHRPCSRACRGYSAQAAADRLCQQTDRRRRSPLTTRIRCCVEQWRSRSSVSSGPLLAVELENGNAPKFRERFDSPDGYVRRAD